MSSGKIVKVSGPLVVASGLAHANMFDVVRVGPDKLIGEIIEMRGENASIQVYEETSGLGPGATVETTGAPLSVELAPGIIENIYDGIQRPLEEIVKIAGNNITRGVQVSPIDYEKVWEFVPTANVGDVVSTGDVVGTVEETVVITHKIMVPVGVSGTITELIGGKKTVKEVVCKIKKDDGEIFEMTMVQKWPVRMGRPYKEKLAPDIPMLTGQRNMDTMFPIAKGGTAAIPGPFGSGKTVQQHQIAKWSDVDIVVYVGCGERGNEMTDVLKEFPELLDPRTGESIMRRTVLIANTSDMPVAAREASVYTGITIAEYFRDMGYDVAVIADSTSRWAEALREMSGRLEEMPGEEGYPAYLASRLAQFYERAGRIKCLGAEDKEGSLTAIGAVSPPGGDISEPVSQATLRIVKVFWGLDAQLAYRRHFPTINWLNSYSLYLDRLSPWFNETVDAKFSSNRNQAMSLLQAEGKLNEIVQLVGIDSLSSEDRVILETARILREDFLQQDSFSDTDSYCEAKKQFMLLDTILSYYKLAADAVTQDASIDDLFSIDALTLVGRAKDLSSDEFEQKLTDIKKQIQSEISAILAEEVE